MKPHHASDAATVYHGDCLEVLRQLPDASVHAVVTDPPYGLEFMGKDWDAPWKAEGAHWREASRLPGSHSTNPTPRPQNFGVAGVPFQDWCRLWAAECLRVLKPGGHLLAFGGTRTWHRLACAVEDAGFEIRDSIAWLYASGFPKSLDVSKAIDKAAGAEREVTGIKSYGDGHIQRSSESIGYHGSDPDADTRLDTAPATPDAQRWQGFGTALKPAHEPVVVARKPLSGTVAGNVLEHGTGALNVDGCRVGRAEGDRTEYGRDRHLPHANRTASLGEFSEVTPYNPHASGRWPANVVLDGSQAAALDEQSGELTSGVLSPHHDAKPSDNTSMRGPNRAGRIRSTFGGDSGGASRYFLVTKEDEPCGDASTRGESTSAGRRTGGSGDSSPTDGCGNRSTAPSHQDTRSTTETTTPSTTTCPTSCASQPNGTTTTTNGCARTTDGSTGLNIDGASDAADTSRSPTSPSVPRELSTATAGTASASISGNGEQPTANDSTRTSGPTGPDALDSRFYFQAKAPTDERPRVNGVAHATVKPLGLMRWLVRLVTPPGGTCLDPFAGTGTTVEACLLEGFTCIAIEREAEYLPLIDMRIARRRDPVQAVRLAGQDGGLFDLIDDTPEVHP